MKSYNTSRLVKSEDLNHHGTLFAGRTAEWFVESAFIAAASAVKSPENIVCLNIHGLLFRSPVKKGDIVTFTSTIAHVGKTSIIVYGKILSETRNIVPVEGFLTFIHVDEDGNKIPHGLVLDEPKNQEEKDIREKALKLLENGRR